MKDALIGLLSSRKAIIVLLVIALCAAAVLTGKATWEQVEGLLWKVIGPWMIAQGVEDAAKHNAGKPAPTFNVTANAPSGPSIPPTQ